ncbi:hypothetical protein ACFCYI_12335 [Streptomyces sp. NPDC056257]|uniref:hypothetical protein n=1 Tax=Streptomyces sp. NPDC056257 TaxID=3345765 RepID=UPI0035D68693
MHTTFQECQDALDAARAQAQGLIHTLAATLAHMDRHAAYLVLRRDSRSGELHLDSLRTAGGGTLCSFDERDLLPELTDPLLRAAWGPTDPRDPQALLQLLRDLDRTTTESSKSGMKSDLVLLVLLVRGWRNTPVDTPQGAPRTPRTAVCQLGRS